MKKNASHLFRIDEQVFTTMAVISLIAVAVLAFRFRYKEPCSPIKISVNGPVFYESTPVYFKAETKNGKIYAWDFGDHSQQVTRKASITHIYSKAGKYTVVLTVNDQCQEVYQVYVTEVPMIEQKITKGQLNALRQGLSVQ
jgi:PKD domain